MDELKPESRDGWRQTERQADKARLARDAGGEKLNQDPESEEAWKALASAANDENEARLQAYNTACGRLMFYGASEAPRDRRGESEATSQDENPPQRG